MSKQSLMEKIDKLPLERIDEVERFVDGLSKKEEQHRELEFERKLFEAGIITEIKPPITDFTLYQQRKPVEIKGRPISEIILEERR